MQSNKLKNGRHLNRLAAIMEGLETRQFCDGSFGTAVALGAVSGLVVKLDHVDAGANHKDFYKLTTSLPGRLRVTLDSISGGDADLFVYNGSQALIGSSSADGNLSELVDKPTVAAGTYFVEVRYFSGGTTNYTLGVQTDYAGNSTAAARQVGAVGTTEKVFKDFIGNSDTQDFYKFNTTANGVVTIKLDGLTNDVDVQLLSSTGTLLKTSQLGGANAELIYHGSAAATYFVKVFQFSSTSNYTLHVSNAPVPADNAGNNTSLAKNVGTLAGTKTFSDWIVNKFDHDDFYKIFVAQPGNIVVNLTGQKANLSFDIEDNNGNVITTSNNGGVGNEVITLNSNFGGTYFVRVFQGGTVGATGVTSPYTLSLTAPADTAPNTMGTAKQLTLSGGTVSTNGFVGFNDVNDWYKLSIAAGKSLTAKLTNLTGDADLELYNSSGVVIASSTAGGTTVDQFTKAITSSGTYFLRVFQGTATSNANYKLTATVV